MRYILLCFVIPISSCHNFRNLTSCSDIKEIIILDKTINSKSSDTIRISNTDFNEFCNLYSKLSPIYSDVRLRNNLGFYELQIYDDDKKRFDLLVIFTVYDGIVIMHNAKRYKQDGFVTYVRRIINAQKLNPSSLPNE